MIYCMRSSDNDCMICLKKRNSLNCARRNSATNFVRFYDCRNFTTLLRSSCFFTGSIFVSPYESDCDQSIIEDCECMLDSFDERFPIGVFDCDYSEPSSRTIIDDFDANFTFYKSESCAPPPVRILQDIELHRASYTNDSWFVWNESEEAPFPMPSEPN